MRLKQRKRVDLPQPEGPIRAETALTGSASLISLSRLVRSRNKN